MKKNIALAAFALLGFAFASAQTETQDPGLPPTADTYLRSNKEVNYGKASTIEIWTQYDSNDPASIVADFAGLMQFDIPEKPGYEVSSATLVLYANVVNGTQNFTIYPFAAEFTEKDGYTAHADAIADARNQEPIVKNVVLNGWHNHGIKDVLTKPGADEKYKNIESWRTDIDITDYVKSVGQGTIRLLFDHNTGTRKDQKIEIFSKDVVNDIDGKIKVITDTGYKIEAKKVMPHLYITYTVTSGIDNVAADKAKTQARKGVYTLSGVRVTAPQAGGVYIIDGKKVMIRKK